MYKLSQSEKLRFLMDRGIPSNPGHSVSPYDIEKGSKEQGQPISARMIYKILDGQTEITSMSKLEVLARYFDVPVAFFSKDPEQWLPPIARRTVHLAVLSSGNLTPDAKAFMADLAARAGELARQYREQQAAGPKGEGEE